MRESTETDMDQPDNADGRTGKKEGVPGVQPSKSDNPKVRLLSPSATLCHTHTWNAVAMHYPHVLRHHPLVSAVVPAQR